MTWRWSLLAETCSYFLLLNIIINPYYHSCGFMTDIYLTISLFYTQRGWHTSKMFWAFFPDWDFFPSIVTSALKVCSITTVKNAVVRYGVNTPSEQKLCLFWGIVTGRDLVNRYKDRWIVCFFLPVISVWENTKCLEWLPDFMHRGRSYPWPQIEKAISWMSSSPDKTVGSALHGIAVTYCV